MPSVFKYNGNEIIDSSGKVTATAMNSSGDAPVYACRAWVNFDGSKDTNGSPSTANTNRLIRASGNVASVLRTGTGRYTITFTTEMPDANYVMAGSAGNDGQTTSGRSVNRDGTWTTTAIQIRSATDSTSYDDDYIGVAVFR